MTDEQNTTDEPQRQDGPDEGAGPAVQPVEGDQGPQVSEQDPLPAGGEQVQDQPVATSAPPPEAQSGVPLLPENADVEPQEEFRGPVGDSGQAPEGPHSEANKTPAAAGDEDDVFGE